MLAYHYSQRARLSSGFFSDVVVAETRLTEILITHHLDHIAYVGTDCTRKCT